MNKSKISWLICTAAFAVLLSACGDSGKDEEADQELRQKVTSYQEKQLASRVFHEYSGIAYRLDRKIKNFESELDFYAKNLQYFLRTSAEVSSVPEEIVYHEKYLSEKEAPQSFRFYEAYGFKQDFGHICCRTMNGVTEESRLKRANDASLVSTEMRQIVSNSRFDSTRKRGRTTAEQMFSKERAPVSLVYLGFQDGLYFCYPGKVYDEKYDPRERGWYKERIAGNAAKSGWSEPYVNANKSDTVITYSIRLDDASGTPTGVVAMDLSLSRMLDEVKAFAAKGIMKKAEITLLNGNGIIIVTTDPDLRDLAAKQMQSQAGTNDQHGLPLPDKELFQRICDFENGYHVVKSDGHAILYAFSKCQSTGWYFLVRVNADDVQKK